MEGFSNFFLQGFQRGEAIVAFVHIDDNQI
jgi:hypothetical protein